MKRTLRAPGKRHLEMKVTFKAITKERLRRFDGAFLINAVLPSSWQHSIDTMWTSAAYSQGTSVMPILTSVLFDKTEWETPDQFNPQHFLDSQGKFVKREAFLPFSAGKRACLGEGLARMELFLFFIGLFQKFSFVSLDGVKLKTEGIIGATRTPHPFQIYAQPL